MIVLICGGRDFILVQRAWNWLDAMHAKHRFSLVVTGLDYRSPKGADDMADRWAWKRGIDRIAFPPNWEGRGKPAGPHRNGEMLRLIRPELVIAFPGGPGTADMCRQADKAGVEVIRVAESAPTPSPVEES